MSPVTLMFLFQVVRQLSAVLFAICHEPSALNSQGVVFHGQRSGVFFDVMRIQFCIAVVFYDVPVLGCVGSVSSMELRWTKQQSLALGRWPIPHLLQTTREKYGVQACSEPICQYTLMHCFVPKYPLTTNLLGPTLILTRHCLITGGSWKMACDLQVRWANSCLRLFVQLLWQNF